VRSSHTAAAAGSWSSKAFTEKLFLEEENLCSAMPVLVGACDNNLQKDAQILAAVQLALYKWHY